MGAASPSPVAHATSLELRMSWAAVDDLPPLMHKSPRVGPACMDPQMMTDVAYESLAHLIEALGWVGLCRLSMLWSNIFVVLVLAQDSVEQQGQVGVDATILLQEQFCVLCMQPSWVPTSCTVPESQSGGVPCFFPCLSPGPLAPPIPLSLSSHESLMQPYWRGSACCGWLGSMLAYVGLPAHCWVMACARVANAMVVPLRLPKG